MIPHIIFRFMGQSRWTFSPCSLRVWDKGGISRSIFSEDGYMASVSFGFRFFVSARI